MPRIALFPITAVTCNGAFDVIENAAIHIEDSRLIYVGPAQDAPHFEADTTIGGDHLVAMPGLINVHTHSAMTLMRGYADDMALEPWLHEKIWPFEANLQPEDVYWGTLLAIAEMLCGGTTCFADMYFFYEDGVRAMLQSGIRACPGAVLLGFLPEPEKRIANGIAFVREYNGAGDGRITPFMAPHSLYTCNAEQWAKIIEGARDLNVPIHTHIAETRREVADVTAEWGAPPIQTLQNIGALDGPLLAAHCVYPEPGDIEIMRGEGETSRLRVAHNPTSNLKLRFRLRADSRLSKERHHSGLGAGWHGVQQQSQYVGRNASRGLAAQGNQRRPDGDFGAAGATHGDTRRREVFEFGKRDGFAGSRQARRCGAGRF